jgi:hypothetical protein
VRCGRAGYGVLAVLVRRVRRHATWRWDRGPVPSPRPARWRGRRR